MITIQMIDEFRRRTHASYDDAKYFLETYNGDMLEAIIAFEKSRTHGFNNPGRDRGRYGRGFAKLLQRLIDIKIIITDKNQRNFNVPILVPIVLVPLWHIFIIVAIALMILGFRLSIREIHDENVNVDAMFQKMKAKMHQEDPKYKTYR